MNTQNRSLHIPEPGVSSNGGPIQGGSQTPGQATKPKRVMRHQSFPEASTSARDFTPSQRHTFKQRPPHRSSKSDTPRTGVNAGLSRHGTLLTVNATPSRAAAELKSILGDNNARLKPKAALLRVDSGSAAFGHYVTLEQAKSRARIEVDIYPQSNVYVQGDHLRGHVVISARPATSKEPPIFMVGGKIRVIGFENLGDKSRSIFYQCSAIMSSIVPELATIYAPERDEEGLPKVKEGNYRFPFSLYLSLATKNGQARGYLRDVPGISLNYIAMASIKIKDGLGRLSIAHFYRNIEVWPRLDPVAILSPARRPLQATVCKSSPKFPNGGRIKLTALLHRLHWISGQSCRIRIIVENDTKKTLKDIIISLHQTTTIYPHSIPGKTEMDLDSRQSKVSSKRIAESTLEVGQPKTKGHASAKGWWLGVGPGQKSEFEHSILIPIDTLTMPRGQLFEVSHQVHVELGGPHVAEGTRVMLPIRIVSFVSVDPSPSKPPTFHSQNTRSPCSRQGTESSNVADTSVCSLDRSSSPSHLKHHDGRKEGRQAEGSNETLAVLESSSKRLPPDPRKVAFRTTSEVSRLGNLSLSRDTNGLGQQNAGTAMPNATHAAFLDQYRVSEGYTEAVCASENEHLDDISDPDSVTSVLESFMKEIAALPPDPCSSEMQATTPQKLYSSGHSRFATRVKEKTRLAMAAYLNGTQNNGFIQKYQRDPTSLQGRFLGGKSHLTPETSSVPDSGSKQSPRDPLTRQLSHSHRRGGHSSDSSDIQNLSKHDERFGIPVESISNFSSGAIPAGLDSSPSGTIPQLQQGCPSSIMVRVRRNPQEDPPRVQSETQTKAKKIAKPGVQNLTPTGATATTSHVSATLIGSVSVKDKIRRLEEQVRAAAPV